MLRAAERVPKLGEIGFHHRDVIVTGVSLLVGERLEGAQHVRAQTPRFARQRLGDVGRDELLGEDGRDAFVAGEIGELGQALRVGLRLG